MNDQILTVIGSIIIAAIGTIPGLIALVKQRRKDDAEAKDKESNAAQRITEAAGKLADVYQDTLAALRVDLDVALHKIEEIEKYNQRLEIDLAALKKDRDMLVDDNQRLTLEVIELQTGVDSLVKQIEKLGQIPAYKRRLKNSQNN
jgi:hypothetical protein